MNDIESPVVLALTRHGGHIGFLAGLWPTSQNLLDRAVPQFASAIFEHLEEFSVATAEFNHNVLKEDQPSKGYEGLSGKLVTFY